MRLQTILTALVLPLTALAAAGSGKSKTDRFDEYRNQQLSSSGALKIDDRAYGKLVAAPRDYSVAVLMTALEARFGCQLCQTFQPEWNFLAKSWAKGDKQRESRLVFGTVDFASGQQTFQSFGLTSAPVLFLFPPTIGPDAKADGSPLRYDFNSGSTTAETVHAWIARHMSTGPHPPVVRPTNWVKIITTVVAVLGVITLLSVTAKHVLPIVQNRNLWAALSLIAVLLFTSGHMFNHIRKVPYVAGDGKGGISYFAGGFQNQLGLETQIVAVMYGILAFATISLALKVPRMTDPKAQQIAVFVWGGVVLFMYSYLLSVFRFKNGGYPFWLPPF